MTRGLAAALWALALCLACGAAQEPGPLRLLPSDAEATIAAETRLALILKPPELPSRAFEVRLPPRARLAFGFGVPNASLVANASPARFRVTVLAADGERRPILDRRLDPAVLADRRWFDTEADLAAFAGQQVSIEFSVSPEPGDGPPPMGAYGNPVIYDPERRDGRPDLVVISIDTLRARSLSAYGYGRETSPFLDELAARGALFENAVTTSVTTGPSHMSLFTGLYPVHHGLFTGLEYKAESVATLAGALRAAGYQTTAFTEDGYIVRTRGFGAGFAEYTENSVKDRKGPGEVRLTFGQAARWLRRARQPFYLFVHTYQVHAPYRPPKRYADLFTGDGSEGPEDPVLLRQRDNYDREIRYVDDRVRELVAVLSAQGLLDHTLLVILADHGEEFQEHGHYQHGGAVFEESIRIPMIFVGPGIRAGRHPVQVSLIDVMPTLLDYAGVPIPPDLDGVSLLPTLQRGEPPPERTLFTEARSKKRWLRPFRGEDWSPPLIGVRSQHGKFIVHRPEHGPAEPTVHYDLQADADEHSPRRVEGEELSAIDAVVDHYLESRRSDAEQKPAESPDEIDPELRKRLELLGYLDPEE